MLQYKIDVLGELNAAGYTTYRLRKEKLIGEQSIQCLRTGKMVGTATLDVICRLLHRQPGDVVEFVAQE